MTSWTPDQLRAIKEGGTNIVVSAGAGSGKTAVLTERVITKLSSCDINRLLVLTFTNAAAAEMKDRIRKAIIKNKMTNQLDYLDSAYITTFDSFAGSIVRKYHYLLNIPSNVMVIDDTVIAIEIEKIINDIFEKHYGQEDFDNLISTYCVKDDKEIRNFIIDLNNKLDLKSDKESYLNTYVDKYFNDQYLDSVIEKYTLDVMDKVGKIKDLYITMCSYLNEKQSEDLKVYLEPLLSSNSYDEIINLPTLKAPGFRNLSDEAKELYEEIKEYKKLVATEIYSKAELKENLLLTKNNIEVIISLVQELDSRLSKFKHKNNSFTFTDIAKMAIKIVKENESVRNELKNFFVEIMVDEYQDTSDLQEEFLKLISSNNLYCVGDVKQSIYRFRHANPSIFKEKYNKYSNNDGGIKIDLLKNFRSRSEVLENINEIFDLIMDDNIGNADYSKSHRMISGNDIYNLKSNTDYNVEILNYDKGEEYKGYTNAEIEAFVIASDIKKKVESKYQVIDKETSELRDVNYGDFCIIMDRGSSFDTYSKIFEYNGIPLVIWSDEKLNVEDDIAVLKNIVNLIVQVKLGIISKEFKYYFTSIARSYLFKYTDNQILDIFVNNKFKENEIYEKCLSISKELDYITNNEFLDMIIDKFNLYENAILKGNIDASMIRYDMFSKLFSSLSNLGYTPYDLPSYFKNSKDLDIKYHLNSKVSNNVNIMNIHKSKGLEFSICYYAGLNSKFNDSDIKDKFLYDDEYGIIIPFSKNGLDYTVLKKLAKNKYVQEDVSEKIRLLYVALTRAKEKMIIVSPSFNGSECLNLVPDDVRLKYKSFYNIFDSISSNLNKYIKEIDLSQIDISSSYNIGKASDLPNIFKPDNKIVYKNIDIDNCLLNDTHFSVQHHMLNTKEEANLMEQGTYIHYLFEITDFENPNKDLKYFNYINNFINKINLKDAKIYKEYEFIYEDNLELKHGVIDLMLEYSDYINIYDYKLKNIDDPGYISQLKGYKKYIESKTSKIVNLYLYSILDDKLKEII